MENTAGILSTKWDVTEDELLKLWQESGLRESDLEFESRRRAFVSYLLFGWAGSSGSPESIGVISGAMEKVNPSYTWPEREQKVLSWLQSRPDLDRPLKSLGRTMYEETQAWFDSRGVSLVELKRRGGTSLSRPFSSWSLHHGGIRFGPGGHGDVVSSRVPTRFVLSIPATGYGTLLESEFVLLPRDRESW